MDISIIIPAFNEESKIGQDIQNTSIFLGQNNLTSEIIVVDDGSSDLTFDIASQVAEKITGNIKILKLDPHGGKGKAVKTGILNSIGDIVLFADSGSCVPLDYALTGKGLIQPGVCDIANGSRKMDNSIISQSHHWVRRIISKTIRFILITWIQLPNRFTDTQCGFKVYDGDIARELYSECVKDGFLFDVEIIMRALKKGYKVLEFPVQWTADLDSRLSPIKHLFGIIKELFQLKRIVRSL
jgi:dolichyl-phosphate beta-glucosyltransferase